jgi:hypothetical protein
VAGCCECGDEPLGSCATELVSYISYTTNKNICINLLNIVYFALVTVIFFIS